MPVSELSHPALAFRLGLLLTLLLGTPGRALAERLPIKTYTTTDGLASDGVNRIVKDSRGFLWFCTSEGLSRFDGYKFTNYGVEQGLPDRRVNDLLETHSGVYWVATDRGLCRFNPSASSQSSRTDAAGYEPRFVIYHLGDDERSDVAHQRLLVVRMPSRFSQTSAARYGFSPEVDCTAAVRWNRGAIYSAGGAVPYRLFITLRRPRRKYVARHWCRALSACPRTGAWPLGGRASVYNERWASG